jgi:hypothetical protein
MGTFDKSTCWYMQDGIVAEMLKNYDVYQPLLVDMQHIKTLKKIIELLPPKSNVVDIGCGSAQISQFFKQHKYTGADLPFVIDKVAAIKHPENPYFYLDIETDDLHPSAFKEYDTILINAFIDCMQYPLLTLEKILVYGKRIILHRQEFTKTGETRVFKNPSYCGETYHSIISIDDFYELIAKYNYKVMATHTCGFDNWEDGGISMLLEKIDKDILK